METLAKRVEAISNVEACILLRYTPCANIGPGAREMINADIIAKIEAGDIDEIELITIESGM